MTCAAATAVLGVVVSASALAPARAATTIQVNTTADVSADDGHCSLREAVAAANSDTASGSKPGECAAGSGADVIVLPAGLYTLTTGQLSIQSQVTLQGAGSGSTTIKQSQPGPVIFITAPAQDVTIQDVAITGGHATSADPGGGIADFASQLTLIGCDVFGNHAGAGPAGSDQSGGIPGAPGGDGGSGGGIYAFSGTSNLTVRDSTISGNFAGDGGPAGAGTGTPGTDSGGSLGDPGGDGTGGAGGGGGSGGAIFSNGNVTIEGSSITQNSAGAGGAGGAGVGGAGGASANFSGGEGGRGHGGVGGVGGSGAAIWAAGTLTVTGSTISANTGGDGGVGGTGTGGSGGISSDGGDGGIGGAGHGGLGGPGGDGGGIHAGGTLTVTGSLVSGNGSGAAGRGGQGSGGQGGSGLLGTGGSGGFGTGGSGGEGGDGGGLQAAAGSTLSNDTVTGNGTGQGGAGGDGIGGEAGGGASAGTSGEGTGGDGGNGGSGAALLGAGSQQLDQDTISANVVASGGPGGTPSGTGGAAGAAGIDAPGGAVLTASILSGGCSGSVTDGGHNVSFPDTSCPGTNADPKLGTLADNGGPTQTQALGAGSAAIDLVPASGAGCQSTDQRGVARPQGAACDAGAYEKAPAGATTGAAGGISTVSATLHGAVNPHLRDASYHFDFGPTAAYGSSTPAADAGAGNADAAVAATLSGLRPSTTYHFRLVASNADGASSGADASFTTGALPAPAPHPASPPPKFTAASLKPAVFAVNPRGRAERPVSAVRRGTTIRFRLSKAARVVFTVQRIERGRRKGRHCVAPKRARRHAKRCTRYVRAGRFAMRAKAGTNSHRFTGRIGRRSLRPGRYRLVLVATGPQGKVSRPLRLHFRVVRRHAVRRRH